MNKMIAFCGINCGECEALIATQKNDEAMRKAVAEKWSMKPEEVNCAGCLTAEGPHIDYCGTCEIRKCGMEKEVENCAYCVDYKCEKLAKFHEKAEKAKGNLEEIRKKK